MLAMDGFFNGRAKENGGNPLLLNKKINTNQRKKETERKKRSGFKEVNGFRRRKTYLY